MKVLFICHRLPYPPKRGGKIRPFNIIRHLTESGFSVTVGSLARSDEELAEGQGLTEYCDKLLVGRVGSGAAVARMIARLPTRVPSSMGYFFSRSLQKDIQQELANSHYDLVFVHCSSVAQYARYALGIPSILDFGDMDSQKWLDYSRFRRFPLSLGYWLEGTKLHREERRLAGLFDVSTCTTQAELETLQGIDSTTTSMWFPNGVDSEYFSVSKTKYDPDQICFVGRMDYFPNQQAMVYFCDEVLPLIRARRGSTNLVIVGAEPSDRIRLLSKRNGITVTGTVADIRPYVQRSAVSVAPLMIARGTQNKILESMAMGVPVVCSAKAGRGVDAVADSHYLIANSPIEYARKIVRVMENSEERDRLALAGRARMLTHHSWKASMARLDKILESVAKEPA